MSITYINRSAILPFTCEQMFTLVNRIEEYPRFLPWCHEAIILSQDEKHIEASLELVWSGIHKKFTTRNILFPHERIDITLVHGPFRHLEGIWTFTPLGKDGCKIDLALEFELIGHMLDRVFQPIFNRIANSLVELFSERAVEVYGNPNEH